METNSYRFRREQRMQSLETDLVRRERVAVSHFWAG